MTVPQFPPNQTPPAEAPTAPVVLPPTSAPTPPQVTSPSQ